jgi:hypothetical protein
MIEGLRVPLHDVAGDFNEGPQRSRSDGKQHEHNRLELHDASKQVS